MVVLFDLLLHAVPPFHYWNALFKFYFCGRFFFPSSKGESEESIQILAVICVLLLWLASRPSFDIREFKTNDATAATTPQNLHT